MTFWRTWRHRSRDDWLRNVWFPVACRWSLETIWHDCWDIVSNISQTYSRWKYLDPHFCFTAIIGGYSILQLCAYSRSLGTSFELLTPTISPRASLLQCSDLPIEHALRGWKWGHDRGRVRRILIPNELVLTFRAPNECAKLHHFNQLRP